LALLSFWDAFSVGMARDAIDVAIVRLRASTEVENRGCI
jgi:hypothetical protein